MIGCMVENVSIREDGTARTPGAIEGQWDFQGDTFSMHLYADADNDGILEFEQSYRGQPTEGASTCIKGEVRDHITQEEGRFWLCL